MQLDDCPRCADLRARLAALRAMLLTDPACNPDGRPAAATVRVDAARLRELLEVKDAA